MWLCPMSIRAQISLLSLLQTTCPLDVPFAECALLCSCVLAYVCMYVCMYAWVCNTCICVCVSWRFVCGVRAVMRWMYVHIDSHMYMHMCPPKVFLLSLHCCLHLYTFVYAHYPILYHVLQPRHQRKCVNASVVLS
jgi:hypothetical protein